MGYAQKVALHSAGNVQFFNGTNALILAYDASVSGDTIYLPGDGFTSPGAIAKNIFIYGAGHYPDSTAVTGKSFIIGNLTLSDNADGFHLEGVDLTGSLTTSTSQSVNQIIIRRCYIQGSINISGDLSNPCLNLMLVNCAIKGNISLANAQNAAIFNSILNGEISSTNGTLFKNNIFLLNNVSSTVYKYTIIGDYNTLENNIFLRTRDREIAGTNNTLKNNITPKADPFWGSVYTADGNYTSVDPTLIFINQTGNVFDYTHNYNLQAPENYIGTDNTQVGIYGGTYPYKEGAVPSNPHFVFKTITPNTDENGMLNVQIKVSAQEN